MLLAMKPASIALLVVSSSFLAFYAGRISVKGSCGTGAAAPLAMPMPMPMPPARPPMLTHDTHPSTAAVGGRVAEVIQVPNYTYLRLTTQSGDTWAAVATTATVKPGDTVTLANALPMSDFTSPTLKRTFATIYFAELAP